jgi:hypothetical protein
MLEFWSQGRRQTVRQVLEGAMADPAGWETRYGNYKHAALFTIRGGRGARGIRKYYAGWPTYIQLSGTNIRYLLELVDQALLAHLRGGGRIGDPISPDVQTLSAQAVGRKNLAELEGLTIQGARLTKLALGLGRVFQLMARQASGHAPEVNQFRVERTRARGNGDNDVDMLLRQGVMHLALLRSSGTKLTSEGDTRDWDYSLHPIFSAFFEFSHRRKRKMQLSPDEIAGLIDEPAVTIERILSRTDRVVDDLLPEQLQLFESFYRGAQG